jgi:hypothetical protein
MRLFEASSDPSIQDCVQRATAQKGFAYSLLKRPRAAIATFDSFLKQYRHLTSRLQRLRNPAHTN